MELLEIRLAKDVQTEYDKNIPFEQFQKSYFNYKHHVYQNEQKNIHHNILLQRKIDTLYQRRVQREWRD